jgi:hypothetical protein
LCANQQRTLEMLLMEVRIQQMFFNQTKVVALAILLSALKLLA